MSDSVNSDASARAGSHQVADGPLPIDMAAARRGEAGHRVRSLPGRRDSARKRLADRARAAGVRQLPGIRRPRAVPILDDYQQGYGDGVRERLRGLLVGEVFGNEEDENEEQLDRTLLFDRLREGLPVLRANDATTPRPLVTTARGTAER
ncbi:hypothetical protein ACFV8T_38985 [Streptomyces sp. NPDC059832]|uniref:hypothetical protein n=1 Tax=unclassified Streptomyces TaxID=2593676 RepID=UPI003652FA3B